MFILVESCKKHPENTQTDFNLELLTVSDYMYPQQFTNQFMLTVFKSLYDSTLINTGHGKIDSATVTRTVSGDTIDTDIIYWYSGEDAHWHHNDGYGHRRMGTIIVRTDTNFYKSSEGNIELIVKHPFYYDSMMVNVQNIYISKTGLSENGNQLFKVIFDHIVLDGTYAHKFTRNLNASFNYEIVKDNSTPWKSENDFILISGTISGNTKTGINYSTNINSGTNRYKLGYQCRYIIEGSSSIVLNGNGYANDTALVDFISNDGCSNYYQITIPNEMTTKSPIE